jgi:ribosomal protein S12 methylthiotransferase
MRYYIDLHGCAKNDVDAENMGQMLGARGLEAAPDADSAELIIVNSCGFIQSAKEESINAVLEWRQLYPRETHPEKKILLAGCLAMRYREELSESLPEADWVGANVGDYVKALLPSDKSLAADAKLLPGSPDQLLTGAPEQLLTGERPLFSLPGSAYLKISDGCNNGCSFCAIPLIRGPLRSRPAADILGEVQALLKRGVKELCFIGQDLASWGKDLGERQAEDTLMGLLERICAENQGDFWMRLLYIHPDHFPLELLDLCERDTRIVPYFDLPFQHGSAKILHAMGRRGDADSYLHLIETIRSRLPGAVLRSTFLTGFPGETEEDLRALLDFQERASLDWAGCFAYSREEGTAAYAMRSRPPKKLAEERRRRVETAQEALSLARVAAFAETHRGRPLQVLVEEKIDECLYLGRLYSQAPEVDGSTVIDSRRELELGSFTEVRITGATGLDVQAVTR